jgi:hypothetical protein
VLEDTASAAGPAEDPSLIAWPTGGPPMPIVTAPISRPWIDATEDRFAARCLPLLIANQAGWLILNSHTFRVRWAGGASANDLTIVYLDGSRPYPAATLFGHGIVTFHIPYLFRTPPGYNLLARGPANMPKDGAYALEGLIETDWAVATFTMNWKLTRADHIVTFEEGEPICMIVPQRRGELEAFRPRVEPLGAAPETKEGFETWATSRGRFLSGLMMYGKGRGRTAWQKHYFHGTSPSGVEADVHQRKLRLRPFER